MVILKSTLRTLGKFRLDLCDLIRQVHINFQLT